ncbi:MAG: DUF1295 domain-containing protein [Corynebacterium sp.]|uniref:DUF1295 domain-containing protein n=1 Tax=unclassified Corynebacterium TaxID=2624378 RepID=UPI00264A0A1C|nr:DUF1295 domain-containing protein [Corynebacterium sp.]MDN5581496.1 DUF1295 domain-containing protein [Corynebacterium sp.]MDN5720462.1 DUF1295 domain-containing protein [Corynebacterium sp.]MDN6324556.1 DUF1295 domain-containing protein [Corynebacterium sp.]
MFADWLGVALACAATTVVVMAVVAVVVRRSGRVAVMDVLWGPLILLNSVTAVLVGPSGAPAWLMLAVVAVWAARLSRHLLTRVGHDVEDPRYEELMEKPASSLLTSVLLPQGAVAWLVSVPLQVAAAAGATGDSGARWALVVVGVAVALAGLVVETVADRQLDAFRAQGVSGRVMDRGLWSWSRHPNYFGEAVVWWGIWIAAAGAVPSAPAALLALVSPVAMTVTLVWGTGARLLEKRMQGRAGWEDYRRRTSAFIPLPPRRSTPPETRNPQGPQDRRSR